MKALSPEKWSDVPKAKPGSKPGLTVGSRSFWGSDYPSTLYQLCSALLWLCSFLSKEAFFLSLLPRLLEPSVLAIAVPICSLPSSQPHTSASFFFFQTAFGLYSTRHDSLCHPDCPHCQSRSLAPGRTPLYQSQPQGLPQGVASAQVLRFFPFAFYHWWFWNGQEWKSVYKQISNSDESVCRVRIALRPWGVSEADCVRSLWQLPLRSPRPTCSQHRARRKAAAGRTDLRWKFSLSSCEQQIFASFLRWEN